MRVSGIRCTARTGGRVVWAAATGRPQRDDLWIADSKRWHRHTVDGSERRLPEAVPLWNGLGTTAGLPVDTRRASGFVGAGSENTPVDSTLVRQGHRTARKHVEERSISYQLTYSEGAALWIWNTRDGQRGQVSDEGLSEFAPAPRGTGARRVAFQRSQRSPVEGFLQMDSDIFVADVTDPEDQACRAKEGGYGARPSTLARRKATGVPETLLGAPALSAAGGQKRRDRSVEKVSSSVLLPYGSNFPVDWIEQIVAWASSDDLYFAERTDRSDKSRLVHYRVGCGSQTVSMRRRPTAVFPGSTRRQTAGAHRVHEVEGTEAQGGGGEHTSFMRSTRSRESGPGRASDLGRRTHRSFSRLASRRHEAGACTISRLRRGRPDVDASSCWSLRQRRHGDEQIGRIDRVAQRVSD